MKKKPLFRIAAACLAVLMLMVTVFALSYDLNGDGKTNVWDLQMLFNQGEAEEERTAALKEALGGSGDELKPNADGVYEIYTALGLYNMANVNTEGKTFKLMNDIDMNGASWTPVANFCGTFEGNHKILSGLVINGSGENVGLFTKVQTGAAVQNLNLQNVTVGAAGNAKFVGTVAGTNAGTITNVTVTGTIADTRSGEMDVYYGVLAGKCEAAGTIAGGTGLSVTDGAGKYTTDGLCANVQYSINPTGTTKGGVAGLAEEGAKVSGIYTDTSYATTLLTEAEQAHRGTVVDNMYQQGTIKWTPSENIYYTRATASNNNSEHTHSNAYLKGRTYTGIPYNHGAGSLDRFMSQMQEGTDAQGRVVTKTGLDDGFYYTDGRADMLTGFIQYMGTDCSSSIGWAWAAVSPARITNNDGSNYGGAYLRLCRYMVPNAYNQSHYGIYQVGSYQLPVNNAELYPNCEDGRNTREIILLNGPQEMAEAYAMTHRGDVLVYNLTTVGEEEDYSNDAGHSRMVAEDPVVIRNADGTIDLEKSYFLTHEQGDGLMDKVDQNGNPVSKYDTTSAYVEGSGWLPDTYNIKYTSWRINHKYTFSVLLTEEGYKAAKDNGQVPGCGWGYVPVTMQAFTMDKKAPYISKDSANPVVAPNSGRLYSNYRTISATMVVKDAEGSVVYEKTGFNGVGAKNNEYRNNCQYTSLNTLFPDATANCVAGQTYTYAVTLHFSDGSSKTFTPDHPYTHAG